MGIPSPLGVGASGLPVPGDQANAVLSGVLLAVGPTQPFAFRGPMNLAIYALINTGLTTTAGSLSATVGSATGLAIGNAVNSVNVPPGTTIGGLVGTTATLVVPPITMPGQVSVSSASISGLPVTTGLIGATVTGPGIPAGTTVLSIPTPAIAPSGTSTGTAGVVQLSKTPTVAPPNLYPVPEFTFARTGNAITVTGADAAAIFTGAAILYSATIQIERSFDGGSTYVVCNIGSGTLAQFTAGTPVSLTFGEPEKNVLYRLNCIAYTSGTINYRISQTGGAAESLAIGPLANG